MQHVDLNIFQWRRSTNNYQYYRVMVELRAVSTATESHGSDCQASHDWIQKYNIACFLLMFL